MGLNKRNCATISFSEIGDAELIELLKTVNYNFAGFCKDLMRDGMKYRGLIKTEEIAKPTIEESRPFKMSADIIEKKKQISTKIDSEMLKKHVESKFDKF